MLRPFQNVFGISFFTGNSPQSDWNFSEQLIYDSLSSQNKLFKLWYVIHSYSQGVCLPLPMKNCIYSPNYVFYVVLQQQMLFQ